MNNGMIIIPIFLVDVGQGRGKVAGIDSDGLTGRERARGWAAHGIRRTGGGGDAQAGRIFEISRKLRLVMLLLL